MRQAYCRDGLSYALGQVHQQPVERQRLQRAVLAQRTLPTLVICGREDRITPPALSEELAAGVGLLGSVCFCGYLLGTLGAPIWMNRLNWRWLTAICAAATATCAARRALASTR